MVRYFFGITDESDKSLLYKYETYSLANRLPKNILPIACDPGGNIVAMSIDGDDYGSVYFWDHEQEGLSEESSSYSSLLKVTNSFKDFTSILEEEVY